MNALDKASLYLSQRPRTAKQVADYLKDKGYEADDIKEAIEQLKEYRYLDDEVFAKMYFEYGFERGRGENRIRRELVEKGVDGNIIDDVVYQLESEGHMPDQYQLALDIAKDIIRDHDMYEMDFNEKKKLEAKVGRRLISRGFSNSIVYKVIRQLED